MVKSADENRVPKYLLGVITSLSIMLAGSAFTWTFRANTQISLLTEKITRMESDKAIKDMILEIKQKQDFNSRSFWKLAKWTEQQVFIIRRELKLNDVEGPKYD